jgi:hypothetical protein
MNEPPIHPGAASVEASDQELAREFQRIEKRDWWVWGYSIFVAFLLIFTVIAFSLPAVRRGAETIFRINIVDVVFGLIALVVLFNVHVISQAILIRGFAASTPRNRAIPTFSAISLWLIH